MGSTWRKDPKGRGRYNSAILLDRTGKVVWHYDKMFPTIGEMESGVLPGRGAKVFDTDFGRIGAIICFDLNFGELLDAYKREGVELLCFLSAFRGGLRVPALAFRNQCFIASSVPGENGVIVDPLGRTLAESSQYGRIIFARIELDARVVHIDYNNRRIPDLKKTYGEFVRIETASPEAVYLITSLHPEVSVNRMIDPGRPARNTCRPSKDPGVAWALMPYDKPTTPRSLLGGAVVGARRARTAFSPGQRPERVSLSPSGSTATGACSVVILNGCTASRAPLSCRQVLVRA